MADWVHCNVCYCLPSEGRKFYLTNCGHLFCGACLPPPDASSTCKICKSSCSSILLSSKMKPEVEIFFTDPAEIVKKHERQLLQVMEFQKNQRKRLASYSREKLVKQGAVLDQMQTHVEQMKQLGKENRVLKAEIQHLKNIVLSMETSQRRPPSQNSNYRATPVSAMSSSTDSPSMKRSNCGRSPFQEIQLSTMYSCGDRAAMPGVLVHAGPVKLSGRTPPPQQMTPFSTPQSNRITVRTPPSNGHMGVIPPYQSTPETPAMHAHSSRAPPAPGRMAHISDYITVPLTPVPGHTALPVMYTPSGFSTPHPHNRPPMIQYHKTS